VNTDVPRPGKARSVLALVSPRSLDARQRRVILLLWLATLPSAYVNTVFTQTVAFAAKEFDVGPRGQGFAAAVVRWGVVIALPFALSADRLGRRRMIVATAWLALTATQTIGRPLGIALGIFILVFATEEMGNDTRAWALSILAIASGAGAGLAVAALPLAGISASSWRWIYVVGLVWLVVAGIITALLPETKRFLTLQHAPEEARHAHIHWDRMSVQVTVAVLANVFIAAVSIFQVRYLTEARGYSAAMASLFTVVTVVPSSIGLIIGGRLADQRGRKRVAVVTIPLGALFITIAYSTSGPVMWLGTLAGGICLALAYPAMSVFRSELFPTAKRNLASALITTASLIGGSAGLIGAGIALDVGYTYGEVMAVLALGPLAVSAIVWRTFPETAHVPLEELNPEDRPI
jgi:MFS family permease